MSKQEQQQSEVHSGANPEVGIGDLTKLVQAIAQAVLTGQTEVPVVHLRIAGKHVDIGPAPVKVS